MRAALLRQRLEIIRDVATSDGQGGQVLTPSTVATVWGQLIPASGSEREISMRLAGEVTHTWSIRYDSKISTLSPKDRFAYEGRRFEILEVLNRNARRREFYGTAKELAA